MRKEHVQWETRQCDDEWGRYIQGITTDIRVYARHRWDTTPFLRNPTPPPSHNIHKKFTWITHRHPEGLPAAWHVFRHCAELSRHLYGVLPNGKSYWQRGWHHRAHRPSPGPSPGPSPCQLALGVDWEQLDQYLSFDQQGVWRSPWASSSQTLGVFHHGVIRQPSWVSHPLLSD